MRSLQVLGQEDLEAVKELRMKTSETPLHTSEEAGCRIQIQSDHRTNLRISRTTQTETQPFKNLNLILSMNLTRHGR